MCEWEISMGYVVGGHVQGWGCFLMADNAGRRITYGWGNTHSLIDKCPPLSGMFWVKCGVKCASPLTPNDIITWHWNETIKGLLNATLTCNNPISTINYTFKSIKLKLYIYFFGKHLMLFSSCVIETRNGNTSWMTVQLAAGSTSHSTLKLSSWRTDANKSPMVGAPDTVNICMHGVSGGKLGSCWGGLVHTSCLQDAKLKFKTRKPIKKQVTDATDGRQYKLHWRQLKGQCAEPTESAQKSARKQPKPPDPKCNSRPGPAYKCLQPKDNIMHVVEE